MIRRVVMFNLRLGLNIAFWLGRLLVWDEYQLSEPCSLEQLDAAISGLGLSENLNSLIGRRGDVVGAERVAAWETKDLVRHGSPSRALRKEAKSLLDLEILVVGDDRDVFRHDARAEKSSEHSIEPSLSDGTNVVRRVSDPSVEQSQERPEGLRRRASQARVERAGVNLPHDTLERIIVRRVNVVLVDIVHVAGNSPSQGRMRRFRDLEEAPI